MNNTNNIVVAVAIDKEELKAMITEVVKSALSEYFYKFQQPEDTLLTTKDLCELLQTTPVQVNKGPFKKGDLVQLIKSDKEPELLEVVFKIKEINRIEYSGVLIPSYKIAGVFKGRTITLRRISNELKFYVKSEKGEQK